MKQESQNKREGFSSSIGVIAAVLGSAVGLGNIWKFPYVTGANGGAAFILVYLVCLALVGLPVMLSEHLIGRATKSNAVGAFKKLQPRRPWFLVGGAGVISAFLIMAFYTTVVGWVYAYIFKSASGALLTNKPQQTTQVFNSLISGVAEPLFWQVLVLIVIGIIIMAGVTKGIERVTKFLMPMLFILLVIIDIRSLSLPGASSGLAFLFKPDFSKITVSAILAALGLAFFKLSVGMGAMITYGSYVDKQENLPKMAVKVALSDTLVSLMAGIAIFPAVFAFGFEPKAGPPLLFIIIPTVFNSMPLGRIFMVLFFLLTAFAATGAMLSLLEVPIAYFTEEYQWSRRKATLITIVGIGLLGSTATLSNSVLSNVLIFGKTFFDFFDFATSNVLLPLGGIFIALFAGWQWGYANVKREMTNEGQLRNEGLFKVYIVLVRYLVPIAIAIILLTGLNIIHI
ncbi:SNF family Na+-dependent transporter [Desulfosporosinus acidiphilus SJ4]|uniref:Transporter n=1 Tax=Desulfosporosinus acidiphilus (strain DSM 22704 / JCM 16185 / SJ4) TaxID=646529 RepID=I4D5G7_DESAJ|nr:sodium-dependent transporter [Desulfosporosinus acidiphilus]AFM41041.1 SNF family Na+-dependent transporter [Desulfosporosinus acidiphilus SJ4]